MTTKNAEQFHKYGWIAKGRKYWSVGLGNPFMLQWFHVHIEKPKALVIDEAIQRLKLAEFRWAKQYPDVPW